jgi:nitrite reductase/ring-hydroxylating ferredoxin subunit
MEKVAARTDFTPPSAKAIDVKGQKVAVIFMGGDFFAVENTCQSCGSELQDGKISGGLLTCPRCPSIYYIRTGAVRRGPATKPLKSYEVRYDSESVYVGPEQQVSAKQEKPVTKETQIKW